MLSMHLDIRKKTLLIIEFASILKRWVYRRMITEPWKMGILVVQHRWEELLQQGRRIIAVGDYNISPFPIDSCDPGPDFDSSM